MKKKIILQTLFQKITIEQNKIRKKKPYIKEDHFW